MVDLFNLYGIFQSNHFADVYSDNQEDIKKLNLETSRKISKIKKAEIYVDYGGSIIDADPLEVKLDSSYSLFIRKESFNLFVNALSKKNFFERENNFYTFHTRNRIMTFTYVPKDISEKINAYDFSQHQEDITKHLDRFHQAISDANDDFAKDKQQRILKQLSVDLKNSKGNQGLN